MKKIFRKYISILLVTIGGAPLLLTSCNFLSVEQYINDMVSLDSVFSRQDYLEQYIGGTAALLPAPGTLFTGSYGLYSTAVDEVQLAWQNSTYAGTLLYVGKVTQNDTYYNNWGNYYKGIRKCNTIFERMDECTELQAMDKREYIGLTHFMRGAFYFYLLEQYGPAVILPEVPLSVDEDVEKLAFERSTYDECVEYICKDLEQAYLFLDGTRPSTLFERPTKYAAAAMMSRLRLYQASPWYNGNTFYSDWKKSDGTPMIAQEKDLNKWAKAAAVSKRIIDSGVFALHTVGNDANTQVAPNASKNDFPNGVGGIDPFHSYADMFNAEALDIRNPEIIMPGPMPSNVFTIAAPSRQGGVNGLGITQKVIDAYRMKDGSDYSPIVGDFEAAGSVPTVATDYALQPSVAKMYLNREPRFYASIGFSECLWPASSLAGTSEATNRTNLVVSYNINHAVGGIDGQNPANYNLTGYTLKKYVHPEDCALSYDGKGRVRAKTFPIFRYAEIILNYVEAINEMQGIPEYSEDIDGMTYSVKYNPEEIMYYFNMIRYRAGLPGITLNEASNQQLVRDLLIRERMVEFLCEGRRYHDLRRWGIAKEEENKPVQGLDVTRKTNERELYYKVVNVYHKFAIHTFEDNMYFWPIPRTVLNKNPKLKQNPGWDGWGNW